MCWSVRVRQQACPERTCDVQIQLVIVDAVTGGLYEAISAKYIYLNLNSLVYLFRRAKFVELNLLYLARLPFLHYDQPSQNLARHFLSLLVQLNIVDTAIKD